MPGRLDGRAGIITGGASGIGLACARRFIAEGARVMLADRNAELLNEVAQEFGANCAVSVVDVTDEADVERMVQSTIDTFGRIDHAINSAAWAMYSTIVDHDMAEFRAVVDTCLTGVMLCVKHEARAMRDQGEGGAIVNIASINARLAAEGLAAYCCSKAGVEMLTRIAAIELGEFGIRVAGIGPGFVDTPLTAFSRVLPVIRDAYIASTPLGRVGAPEDIADAALFLVSDDGRWVSGDTLFVDGASMQKGYPEITKIASS